VKDLYFYCLKLPCQLEEKFGLVVVIDLRIVGQFIHNDVFWGTFVWLRMYLLVGKRVHPKHKGVII